MHEHDLRRSVRGIITNRIAVSVMRLVFDQAGSMTQFMIRKKMHHLFQ